MGRGGRRDGEGEEERKEEGRTGGGEGGGMGRGRGRGGTDGRRRLLVLFSHFLSLMLAIWSRTQPQGMTGTLTYHEDGKDNGCHHERMDGEGTVHDVEVSTVCVCVHLMCAWDVRVCVYVCIFVYVCWKGSMYTYVHTKWILQSKCMYSTLTVQDKPLCTEPVMYCDLQY